MRRAALAAIVLATVAIAAGYASAFLPGGAPAWAPWLFALALPWLFVGVMALGSERPGRGIGRLALPFAFVWLILSGGFALLLGLPGDGAPPRLIFGLPLRAAIILYGIGLLPVLVLPVAYALTFDELTLTDDDLERVRAARRPGPPA